MSQQIYYLDELMRLVEHQHQRDYSVRYSFQVVSGDDQHLLFVSPLKKEGPDAESSTPILRHPNREPLLLWSEHGYIEIVEGGTEKGYGIFRLTRLATSLKGR